MAVQERFVALDGLRGLAALAVFCGHAGLLGEFPTAYVAVDLFFVLSGFVIAHAYEQRLQSGWPALRFMAIRLVRLYPCYILGTAIGIAFVVAVVLFGRTAEFVPWRWQAIAAAVAMVPGFGGASVYAFNGPAWSLFYELAANFAYAAGGVRLSTKALLVVSACAGAVLGALGIFHGDLTVGVLWDPLNVLGGTARVTFGFPLGVAIYRLRSSRLSSIRLPTAAIFACAALVLFWTLPPSWTPLHDLLAVLLILPLLVVTGANADVRGPFARVCELAGAASYPLYAIHAPLLLWIGVVAERAGLAPSLRLALAIPGIVLLAFAVDRFFDRPVRRALIRLLGLGLHGTEQGTPAPITAH